MDGYCNISIGNHELIKLIRFVSRISHWFYEYAFDSHWFYEYAFEGDGHPNYSLAWDHAKHGLSGLSGALNFSLSNDYRHSLVVDHIIIYKL